MKLTAVIKSVRLVSHAEGDVCWWGLWGRFRSRGGMVMTHGSHDDVAEWDGGAWGEEQCLDEIDGYCSQGEEAP